jgi:hypothetical protein
VWEIAARAGLKAQVIHVPVTFPADDVGPGHMLSGLGVPDMRGRIGTPMFFTSDPTFQPGGVSNEFSLEYMRLLTGAAASRPRSSARTTSRFTTTSWSARPRDRGRA